MENNIKNNTKNNKNNSKNNSTSSANKSAETNVKSGCDCKNEKLLNTIFSTCKLSMNSIEDVITSVKNMSFQTAISDVHSSYEIISKECQMLAKSFDIILSPVDCVTKFKNWAAVKIGALLDCSTANLAKILYGGTSCEIAEVIQKTCECEGADADIITLAEKLQNLQEKHIHELKKHLCTKE